MRRIETTRTFLTAAEIDSLVGDYLAGAGAQELAERYGIHRATVFAHQRRRTLRAWVFHEQAEAARFYRDGVSIRAISRRMGVVRKAVRTSLVRAQVVIRN